MALTYFKPNKQNKGALFDIKFVAKQSKKEEKFKEGCFYINLVRQVSWNEKSHVGSFSGGESIGVKLSQFEAGKILHIIERNWNLGDISKMERDTLKNQYGFGGMHTGQNQTVYINFVPWQRPGAPEQTGFGLYVTKMSEGQANSTFAISFPFGDDIVLREYLKLGLEHISMAAYAEDKRRFEESIENKQNGGDSEKTNSKPISAPNRGRGRGPAKPKVDDLEDEEAKSPESEPESTSNEEEEPLF